MRKRGLLILMFFCFAELRSVNYDSTQKTEHTHLDYFRLFLFSDPLAQDINPAGVITEWDTFLKKAASHPGAEKTTFPFIVFLFNSIHKNYLHEYDIESNFGNLFLPDKTYNCVTSTALLSSAFKSFDIPFVIRETNYHVYILLPEHKMLVESTNKNGLIYGRKAVKRKIAEFSNENALANKGDYMPLFIDKELNIDQFAGLLYFNLAIDRIRQEDWVAAMPLLSVAEKHYYSLRISYLKMLVATRLPENQNIYVSYKL